MTNCPITKIKDCVTAKLRKNAAVIGWIMASFFYFYEVILRVSPSVMTEQLMEYFQISATSLGWLSTSYYMSYFILQIPCGMIVDHYGPRRVITISSLICVSGTVIFCTQQNFFLAMFGRMLIGVGSACAFISCLKLATDWFSPHRFALIAGIANMMGTLGATLSGRPLATLVDNYGWQNACLCLAAIGLCLTPLIWIFVHDKKHTHSHEVSLRKSLSVILKTKQLWLIGIIGGVLYLPITAFAELWGVPYMMRVYSINNQVASQATVMIFIGMAIGGPVFSYISKHLRSYKKTMLLCATMASILFVGVSLADRFSYDTMFIMLFAIGFMIGGQVLAFTLARNSTHDRFNGTAMGFTNGLISMVGLIFQPFLGKILDIFWSGEIAENGVRIYTIENYQWAIFTLSFTLVASVILLLFVKDNYSTKHNNTVALH